MSLKRVWWVSVCGESNMLYKTYPRKDSKKYPLGWNFLWGSFTLINNCLQNLQKTSKVQQKLNPVLETSTTDNITSTHNIGTESLTLFNILSQPLLNGNFICKNLCLICKLYLCRKVNQRLKNYPKGWHNLL